MSKSDVLGRYQLLHLVHQGYLGPLWAARGTNGEIGDIAALVRRVQLPDSLSEDEQSNVIEASWDSLELSHPNLAKLGEVVFEGGIFALVYDYIEAEVLQALLLMGTVKKTPLSPEVVARILMDIVEALNAVAISAEGLGVMPYQGGVTPESVLVGSDGHTRLIDFIVGGVASALPAVRTTSGRVAYCSPEQLRGDKVDEQSDVFALGVMLAELIAGRRLLLGGPQVIEKKIVEGKLPQINGWLKAEGGIDARLLDVLDRAIAVDKGQRIGSLRMLADEFCAAVSSPAPAAQVGAAVHALAQKQLEVRGRKLGLVGGPRLSERVVRGPRSSRRPSHADAAVAASPALAAAGLKAPRAVDPQSLQDEQEVPTLAPAALESLAPDSNEGEALAIPNAPRAASDESASEKETAPPPPASDSAGVDALLAQQASSETKPSEMQSGTHRKVLSTLIGVAPPPKANIGGPPPLAVPVEVRVTDAVSPPARHEKSAVVRSEEQVQRALAGTALNASDTAAQASRGAAGIADLLRTSVPATRGPQAGSKPLHEELSGVAGAGAAEVHAQVTPVSAHEELAPAVEHQLERYRRWIVVLGATTVLALTLLGWLLFEGLREFNADRSAAKRYHPRPVPVALTEPAPVAPQASAAAEASHAGAAHEGEQAEDEEASAAVSAAIEPAPAPVQRPVIRKQPQKKKVFVPDGI